MNRQIVLTNEVVADRGKETGGSEIQLERQLIWMLMSSKGKTDLSDAAATPVHDMAYQVIKMYGDFEPWWFLDDWQSDIKTTREFQTYEDALAYYQKEWQNLQQTFPKMNSKANLTSGFWQPDEQRWCEECDEYLQQYHSLLLLENWRELPETLHKTEFEQRNAKELHPSCSLKQHNTLS